MATKHVVPHGLNWRSIFAISLTVIAHVAVFGTLLMPVETLDKLSEHTDRDPLVTELVWETPPPLPPPPFTPIHPPLLRETARVEPKQPVQPTQVTQPVSVVTDIPNEEPAVQDPPQDVVIAVTEITEASVSAGYGKQVMLRYPPVLQRRGIEGQVMLRVLVGEDGRAVAIEFEKRSGHNEFDREAMRSVALFKFNPSQGEWGSATRLGEGAHHL